VPADFGVLRDAASSTRLAEKKEGRLFTLPRCEQASFAASAHFVAEAGGEVVASAGVARAEGGEGRRVAADSSLIIKQIL